MISQLHSAVIDVADFEAGANDYARLLGHAPRWIETNDAAGTRSAHFPLANMRLEVRGATSARDPLTNGLSGLRLQCDDLDRAVERLEARGISAKQSVAEEATGRDGETLRQWRSIGIDTKSSRGLPVELVSDEVLSGAAAAEGDPSNRANFRGGGASVDPASAVRALDHVVVFSADADTTRDFYGDGLGIRLALDRSFENRGVRLLFFRVGGTTIEIGSRLGAEPKSDEQDRFGGLAWQVPDIDAIRSRLLADGFDVSEIRDGNKPGTRVCTARDPVHEVPTLLIEPVS